MKPQVYKDDRPAEYFDQFHASARRGVGWTYTFVRVLVSLPTLLLWRVRAIGVENVPKTGAADPGAQPLQPDGPLLHRPLPAPQDPLHGQIADLRPAGPDLRLQARRRLPGAPRPPRRGGVQDRLHAPRPGGDAARSTPRAAARARASWASRKPGSAGWRSNRARRSSRSRSTAPPRCGAGSASPSPRCTVQFGEPLSFAVETEPDRERQLEVASEVFDRVREMYAGLDGGASFTPTQRGLRKTLSAPLTFRRNVGGREQG